MEALYQQIKELKELLSFFSPGAFPGLEQMLSDMEQHQDGAFSLMARDINQESGVPF